MKLACEVIQDLIPLVIDGVASEESEALVMQHIQTCGLCLELYDDMQKPIITQKKESHLLRSMQKKVVLKEALLLAIGVAFVNYLIGNGYLMFVNIFVLPMIGTCSYLILRRKWYYAVLGLVVFMSVYTIGTVLVLPTHSLSELFFIIPALVLLLIGVGIGALLFYAFAKEEVYHEKKK